MGHDGVPQGGGDERNHEGLTDLGWWETKKAGRNAPRLCEAAAALRTCGRYDPANMRKPPAGHTSGRSFDSRTCDTTFPRPWGAGKARVTPHRFRGHQKATEARKSQETATGKGAAHFMPEKRITQHDAPPPRSGHGRAHTGRRGQRRAQQGHKGGSFTGTGQLAEEEGQGRTATAGRGAEKGDGMHEAPTLFEGLKAQKKTGHAPRPT